MTETELRRRCGIEAGAEWPAYAWPGGYQLSYVCDDGEELCPACMNRPDNPIHFDGDSDGWKIIGVIGYGADADYPDTDMICAHCNAVICEASS